MRYVKNKDGNQIILKAICVLLILIVILKIVKNSFLLFPLL